MSKYLSWLFMVFLGIVIDIGGIGFISYRGLFGIMPVSCSSCFLDYGSCCALYGLSEKGLSVKDLNEQDFSSGIWKLLGKCRIMGAINKYVEILLALG